MKNQCVFDSNILIYYLNASLNELARQQVQDAIERGAFISVITRIEVLGWFNHTNPSLSRAEDLLSYFTEQPLSEEIVKCCIQLRQSTSLKVPDAIIAATALHLELPLMTRNIKDFQKVPDLKWINPFEPQ
ncbi:MAG: type II toxin-antitoxin system VapC family toxin [Candidatus Parabeggiatoa sp.]|nr:type II toxin-antitoxin system VapC family toxin [Candidatus Parabeggiatoa sp.]